MEERYNEFVIDSLKDYMSNNYGEPIELRCGIQVFWNVARNNDFRYMNNVRYCGIPIVCDDGLEKNTLLIVHFQSKELSIEGIICERRCYREYNFTE